jgi:effector-binding domain-containing protein
MSQENTKIEHKKLEDTLVATTRLNPKSRKEINEALDQLKKDIAEENIAGPGFCIIQFVTSVKEGYDVEIGYPVNRNVERGGVKTRILPGMDVVSLVHRGPVKDLGKSYNKLYSNAYEHGLISDEFCLEVYLDSIRGYGKGIEIQFVIHNWTELLAKNLARVLGVNVQQEVMMESDRLTFGSTAEDRFQWTKAAIERLESLANEEERYDIVSSCAHVFPKSQIEKLRAVYEASMQRTSDIIKAVDAVIAFMADDPGWAERPRREGTVIYSSKKPRDAKAYEKAQDESEKKKAYCYCPLVREHLDAGMPITFCYCGAGWYRQQWEGVLHRPVKVEIVSSILKGDDRCEFAIHLPDDLPFSQYNY